MKYGKIVVAAALILCFILAACGCRYTSNTLIVTEPAATLPQESSSTYYNPPESTTAPVADSTTLPADTSELPTVTEPSTTAVVPDVSTTGNEAPSTTEAPVTEVNPATWSKQEVVKYLSDAVNKTKAYTGQLTVDRSEDLGITIEELKPNIPALKGIANSLVGRFIKPVNEQVTFSGGKGISDDEEIQLLLPKDRAFTLPADGVTSAKASKSGNNIVIDITLVEESSTMTSPPKYNSQGLGYLDVSKVDLSVVTIEKLDFVYLGSTIHAVIGPDGYVLSADYHIPLKVSASGKAIGVTASFSGTGYQTEKWVIHW